jgi:N-acetylglucosamine-6-phosphate deacetylase
VIETGKSRCLKLSACDIFECSQTVSYGRELLVRNGRFDSTSTADADILDFSVEFSGLNVFPGPIDCQINGAGEILFEDLVSESQLLSLDLSLAARGTTRWCGTFASAPCNKIERTLRVIEHCTKPIGLVGIHFEGPWLNPNYKGFHPSDRILSSSPLHVDLIERATRFGKVITTIAPEVIAEADLARIRRIPGLLVCVGHSEAGPDLIEKRIGPSLRGLTHVCDCMPPITASASGPFGIMMRTNRCWSTLICNGQHVCKETFHIIKRSSNRERVFLVSDQMPTLMSRNGELPLFAEAMVSDPNVTHTIRKQTIGNTDSLVDCMRTAISGFSLPADEAIRMGTEYPAKFLGISDQYGTIEVGRHADFIVADNQLNVRAVFRDGVRVT